MWKSISSVLFAAPLLATSVAWAAETPISGVRQLTFEGRRAGEGYFDKTGSRMIFQSERASSNPFYQMFVMDLETGDVDLISTGVGKTTCGWLHPDGDRALFASTQFDTKARIKMQAELEFRASGKSRRYSWDYDPTFDIVETRTDGEGGFKRLTDAHGYDAEGAYSPDGAHIVFASNRHAYASELTAEEKERLDRDPAFFMELYVMKSDGTDVRRLTETPGYDGGPFWSADGGQITWRRFSEDGARAEIYVMDMASGEERRLTDLGVLSWAPFFHPSGDYLIFSTNLQGFANFELYIVDAVGAREPVRVTTRERFDSLPTFSPDGATISWTSNATSTGGSQIFVGKWDHAKAKAMLAASPERMAAATPLDGTTPGIATADVRRHVEALTAPEMEGRLTATEGGARAVAYVADTFKAMGLAPAGDDGGMLQAFPFTSGVTVGAGSKLTISIDGEETPATLDTDWRPVSFSSEGAVEKASVAFVGYGLVAPAEGEAKAFDSYGDVDVSGNWALIWRGMPGGVSAKERTRLSRYADLRYKASVAKSRGAKGVIFAPPPREGFSDKLPRLFVDAAAGAAGLPALAVDRANMTKMLSILGDDLAPMTEKIEAGEAAGRALIGVAAIAEIDLEFETSEGHNVIARLELDGVEAGGRAPIVIGAHVDHLGRGRSSNSRARGDEVGQVHPGADDNASGVAALIEVAQNLAAAKDAGKLEGARDIVFAAWSGEEFGLLGSTHFVAERLKAAGKDDLAGVVSAYLNMDMIGRLEDNVIVSGVGSSTIWPREIERRNAVVGLPITPSNDAYLPTDSTAFYLKGAPILSVFTGAHSDYHSPRDSAEKLNYDGVKDIARFVALVGRSLAKNDADPDYIKTERPKSNGGRRMSNVFLGTIPDYAKKGEKQAGVPISGAVKGSPAEKAGLKGGDVIVGLAGQDVDNIYDYVRTLNGLKPGEETSISVKRAGDRVTLDITPASRN